VNVLPVRSDFFVKCRAFVPGFLHNFLYLVFLDRCQAKRPEHFHKAVPLHLHAFVGHGASFMGLCKNGSGKDKNNGNNEACDATFFHFLLL